ncbi:hypothetical protein H072_1829 [Dactylellina haptotyla CBS 200.50]|uniref:F-box domain-containing protein n=1 Tax=Dactylellina haptotyla (strain CBS 200.50) TaxID=1284197 RepID=S8C917_DACHA|nr:hypothetical protein H072_1829 [Dactylellina haptotyla CBS 200.50]
MTITSLPVEIQSQILSYLPVSDQISTSQAYPLWREIIINSTSAPPGRYASYTDSDLPSIHTLLQGHVRFGFTYKDGDITSFRFMGLEEEKNQQDYGEWEWGQDEFLPDDSISIPNAAEVKNYKISTWMDLCEFPYLDKPLFSPFEEVVPKQYSGNEEWDRSIDECDLRISVIGTVIIQGKTGISLGSEQRMIIGENLSVIELVRGFLEEVSFNYFIEDWGITTDKSSEVLFWASRSSGEGWFQHQLDHWEFTALVYQKSQV